MTKSDEKLDKADIEFEEYHNMCKKRRLETLKAMNRIADALIKKALEKGSGQIKVSGRWGYETFGGIMKIKQLFCKHIYKETRRDFKAKSAIKIYSMELLKLLDKKIL